MSRDHCDDAAADWSDLPCVVCGSAKTMAAGPYCEKHRTAQVPSCMLGAGGCCHGLAVLAERSYRLEDIPFQRLQMCRPCGKPALDDGVACFMTGGAVQDVRPMTRAARDACHAALALRFEAEVDMNPKTQADAAEDILLALEDLIALGCIHE